MGKSLTFSGSLNVNVTDAAPSRPIPVNFPLGSFSKQEVYSVDVDTATGKTAVNVGALTAPKFIYIEVESGALDYAWDGLVDTVMGRLSAAADPAPVQRPFLAMGTPVGTSRTLYFSTPGACKATIFLFQ